MDLCRRHFRTGVLASFYLASAVSDGKEKEQAEPEKNDFCRRVQFCLFDLAITTRCGSNFVVSSLFILIFSLVSF